MGSILVFIGVVAIAIGGHFMINEPHKGPFMKDTSICYDYNNDGACDPCVDEKPKDGECDPPNPKIKPL